MVDVRIKPLEWEQDEYGCFHAETEIGEYIAWPNGRAQFGPFRTTHVSGGEKGAMAAGEADYERRIRSTLSDAVQNAVQSKAEREAEPVASVAEVRADGQRLYNTVYPSDALDKFPIGTLLYTFPPTSELEALRKRVAELEKALDGLLSAETAPLHVGYDNGVGGGNYVYADVIRIDCEEFVAARRVREGGKVE